MVDLLTDVSSCGNDFKLPSQFKAKAISKLRAMFEIPQAAREPMRTLRHGDIAPRQVGSRNIDVSITKQEDQTTTEISPQVSLVEIKPAHANWIIGSEIWEHVHSAVGCDCAIDGRAFRERQIAQHILSACRIAK